MYMHRGGRGGRGRGRGNEVFITFLCYIAFCIHSNLFVTFLFYFILIEV